MGEVCMYDYAMTEEILRYLFVEGNAFHARQIAERMGVSKKYFDKKYVDIRNGLSKEYPELFETTTRNRYSYSRLKYDSFKNTENVLVWFYRQNKEYKESELIRLVDTLRALHDGPKTIDELNAFIEDDERKRRSSYERSLNYLKELKVVKTSLRKQSVVYEIDNELFDRLTLEEAVRLYFFVNFAANTGLQSVYGYLLQDVLSKYIHFHDDQLECNVLSYKYIYFARLLDEYKLSTIVQAMEDNRRISFHYYKKNQKAKHLKQDDRQEIPPLVVIPIRLVYDHQYGRWYLIAKDPKAAFEGFGHYKLEGIFDIEIEEKTDTEEVKMLVKQFEETYGKSWLLGKGELQKVRLKFYFRSTSEQAPNFIKNRVLEEKQWGEIVEEDGNTFIYEIDVNGTMEIKPWIQSFGSSVEVLEPAELRQRIKDEWQQLLEEYEDV